LAKIIDQILRTTSEAGRVRAVTVFHFRICENGLRKSGLAQFDPAEPLMWAYVQRSEDDAEMNLRNAHPELLHPGSTVLTSPEFLGLRRQCLQPSVEPVQLSQMSHLLDFYCMRFSLLPREIYWHTHHHTEFQSPTSVEGVEGVERVERGSERELRGKSEIEKGDQTFSLPFSIFRGLRGLSVAFGLYRGTVFRDRHLLKLGGIRNARPASLLRVGSTVSAFFSQSDMNRVQ
jgi:hypothetical protein